MKFPSSPFQDIDDIRVWNDGIGRHCINHHSHTSEISGLDLMSSHYYSGFSDLQTPFAPRCSFLPTVFGRFLDVAGARFIIWWLHHLRRGLDFSLQLVAPAIPFWVS